MELSEIEVIYYMYTGKLYPKIELTKMIKINMI